MQQWILALALMAGPVAAADDLAAMNAASAAWDEYLALQKGHDPDTAGRVATSTFQHYAFLRDAALHASPEQLRRLPSTDRVTVYGLRARHDAGTLAGMDGEAVFRDCIESGLCTAMIDHAEITLRPLAVVTLVTPSLAVGEGSPPDGRQFDYGPSLVLEDGRWRVRVEGMALELSAVINGGAADADPGAVQHLVEHGLPEGEAAPLLAQLDIVPVSDTVAQRELNERWPDYGSYVRDRVGATRVKAEAGDPLAQWAYGSLLYTGESPELVPHDEAAGVAMMEASSNGGHVEASLGAAMALLRAENTRDLPPERIERALPHVRRAAEAGLPLAMGMYAQYYTDGAAGLPVDCAQADHWLQKAEDAGLEEARNNRAWLLATCSRADQRDPEAAMALAGFMVDRLATLNALELDTLAAVYAANGDFEQARRYQQDALDKLADDQVDERGGMQARLALYRDDHVFVDTEPDLRSTP
ncbi:sel1 repeat family protein [Lysobacter sp. SG-8]|uniref:Sel1 repeat family protein n=1 Tax=Marilutibacter penaei TaxID=2759900 RepID=A0A7W3U1I6_9GAMM|nr:sel1 repeat family protein [Lysobacter penaei]MBB1087184.1 sel1 repeat family protein [Lysobacter penaei]